MTEVDESGVESVVRNSYCSDTRLWRVVVLLSSHTPLVIVVVMSLALASVQKSSIIPLLYPQYGDVPTIGKLFFHLLPWSIAGTTALLVCGCLAVLAPHRISAKVVIILASAAFNTAVAWACLTVTSFYMMNAVRNAELTVGQWQLP